MAQDDQFGGFDAAAFEAITGAPPHASAWGPPAGMGHNNPPADETIPLGGVILTQAAQQKLRQFVTRVERIEEEQRELSDHKKAVYGEAKSAGYDTKTIRKVVALRKRDRQQREEEEALLDVYMVALGEAEAFDARD